MERKERRHHTREFKLEAVRLAAIGDKPNAKIARELGIRVNPAPRRSTFALRYTRWRSPLTAASSRVSRSGG